MFLPNTSVLPHTTSSSGTSVSTPQDTCIPISHELNFVQIPQIASRPVNFERFTAGRLSFIPGIVKLYESPGRAGGLLRIIYPLIPFLSYTILLPPPQPFSNAPHRAGSRSAPRATLHTVPGPGNRDREEPAKRSCLSQPRTVGYERLGLMPAPAGAFCLVRRCNDESEGGSWHG
jgi:hypothetical protein